MTSACLNDTSCRALDDCVNACAANGGGDAGDVRTCVQACYAAQAPAVQKAWRAYNDCLAAACVKNGNGPCQ